MDNESNNHFLSRIDLKIRLQAVSSDEARKPTAKIPTNTAPIVLKMVVPLTRFTNHGNRNQLITDNSIEEIASPISPKRKVKNVFISFPFKKATQHLPEATNLCRCCPLFHFQFLFEKHHIHLNFYILH